MEQDLQLFSKILSRHKGLKPPLSCILTKTWKNLAWQIGSL